VLNVQQVKGNPEVLDGRVTVYAQVDIDPADFVASKHPAVSMVHNGMLVAQGNYRDQYSLRDFLRSEMGVSLEEGIEQLLSRVDGLESALDPEKLKEKMQEMEGMEELMPTPAKIVMFHSEDEIRGQDGDVYYAGEFRSVANAMLAVQALPMIYQSRYREQVMDNVRQEIDRMVGQVERSELPAATCETPGVNVAERLIKEYIPNMLYARKEPKGFQAAERQFRAFMRGYRFDDDIRAVVDILRDPQELNNRHLRLLELYARKMAAVQSGDTDQTARMQRALENLTRDQGQGQAGVAG
jgi:hypothetical protein